MIILRERRSVCEPWRVRLVIACCLLAFASLLGGASWRAEMQGEMLVSESESRYIDRIGLNGERGVIWDRNGRPLAMSSVVYSASVNPILYRRWAKKAGEARDKEVVDLMLASVGLERERLNGILGRDQGFAYLRHNMTPDQVLDVAEIGLPHLSFEKRYRRYYPSAHEAAHVTGFINREGKGKAGIEAAMDVKLAPVPGEGFVLRTTRGKVLERLSLTQAEDGEEVVLSIDSRLQYFASQALAGALDRHEAKSASMVIMDVHTGDILAMANVPTFNPNSIGDEVSPRRNRSVQDVFEPGSTMKPILAAVAIEEGLIEPGTLLKTAKPIRFGKYTIKDKKINTDLTVAEVIMRSSNVGAVRISELLEDEQMWHGYSRFGFGSDPFIGLPGEETGTLRPHETWRAVEKATMTYGYGLSANLLQVARAYAAIGNGGLMPTPGLILGESRATSTRAVSSETARTVIGLLENVVSRKGTAPKAAVPGYRIAGKTGTTNKRKEGEKGYDSSTYQALFVGLAPASAPRFVCAVMVDRPTKNGHTGGSVAAPVFSQLMKLTMLLYGVPPDEPEPPEELVVASAGKASGGG